jgi:hypothetical protein
MNDDSVEANSEDKRRRMAETVRLVLARRERAPRSPRMERALKRLIFRYTQPRQDGKERSVDVKE